MAIAASRFGLRRMISSIPGFTPPPPAAAQPAAEPSTNLFVSGLSKRTTSEGLREAFAKFGEILHEHWKNMERMRLKSVERRYEIQVGGERIGAHAAVPEWTRVVTDRVSGYSKGFGFVRYATLEQAAEGIKGMHGQYLDGWVIFAEYARPRPPPSHPQDSQPQSGYSPSGFY